MIQMIPILSNQHLLEYKKVWSWLTWSHFGWQLIFLSSQVGQCSCPIHATASIWLAEAIVAKKLDKYGQSCHHFILPQDVKVSAECKQPITNESYSDIIQVDTDTEDKNFLISVFEGRYNDNSLDSDNNDIKIGNEEV